MFQKSLNVNQLNFSDKLCLLISLFGSGFDGTLDTPVEILHVVLLGVIKVVPDLANALIHPREALIQVAVTHRDGTVGLPVHIVNRPIKRGKPTREEAFAHGFGEQ